LFLMHQQTVGNYIRATYPGARAVKIARLGAG
jgi:hypothetical protein